MKVLVVMPIRGGIAIRTKGEKDKQVVYAIQFTYSCELMLNGMIHCFCDLSPITSWYSNLDLVLKYLDHSPLNFPLKN